MEKSPWAKLKDYHMTLNMLKNVPAKTPLHFSCLENKMLLALDSRLLHTHVLSCLTAVALLRISPLSSPQGVWEQLGYGFFTLNVWTPFFSSKKGAVPHDVDEEQMLMEQFQDGKEL